MLRRRSSFAALVGVAVVGLLIWLLMRSSGPTLRATGDGGGGASGPNSAVGQSYVFVLRDLCTTGDAISIINVAAAHPTGGMRVDSWGIRREYPGDGYSDVVPLTGSVSQMDGFGHNAVTEPCASKDRAIDNFAVSVSMSTGWATLTGVSVSYRSHRETRRLFVEYGISLCTSGGSCPEPPLG